MKYVFLVTLSLSLLSVSAKADTYSAWEFKMLQGLAQSSDTVVTATIESVTVGVRGDIYKDTTDTKVDCKVANVYLGTKQLKGKTITVVFGAADEPIQSPSTKPVLLLLKKENDNYRLSFSQTYGVFRLEKGIVQIAFEPKKKKEGLYWTYYTVKEIVARIKSYSKSKIEMTAQIADDFSLSDGFLPITFNFKNTGERTVLLMPPSYCFDSFWIERIIDKRDASVSIWEGVEHWYFLSELEPLLKLEVNSERSFKYRIPFEELKIDKAGNYQVNFKYRPYRLSKWGEKAQITKEQQPKVWFGTSETSKIISITNAK